MDDFVISNLRESKNEWCCYLVDVLTPLVAQGVRSIFQTAYKMCLDKNEVSKYLMTFQNLLSQVAKWNALTIEEERKRIVDQSGCSYIEELIVCVHIIHLKVMTHIRVGNKQKKVDISLPKLDDFVHKCYVHVARRVYKNVYLFEMGLDSLTQQKYNRELEMLVQESVLATVRDSIPKEQIIRAFMDETVEQEEEIIVDTPPPSLTPGDKVEVSPKASELVQTQQMEVPQVVPSIENVDDKVPTTRLTFNDFDSMMGTDKKEETKFAPKDIATLEQASLEKARQRQQEEEESRLKLSDSSLSVDDLGILDLSLDGSSTSGGPALQGGSVKKEEDLMSLLDIQTL